MPRVGFMSRSRKKNPYHSITCIGARAGMMKDWKKMMAGKMRRAPIDDVNPDPRQFGSMWQAPNDGKTYWNNPKAYRK